MTVGSEGSVASSNSRALIPRPTAAVSEVAGPSDGGPGPAATDPLATVDTGSVWPPPVRPTPWAGWPTDWPTPPWGGGSYLETLTDVAWMCLDKNSSILAAMPPYLVGAAPSLDVAWLSNPDPMFYNSWEEFARQLFWDFQGCGEAIVIATARYRSEWPQRFHLLPPWTVDIQFDGPERRYSIDQLDVTDDILHIRYQSRITDAHGFGPLAAGRAKMVAANLLNRYADNLFAGGAVPTTALVHPGDLTAAQASDLQTQWVTARQAAMGIPAVLSGGVDFRQIMLTPRDLALTELSAITETRIANLLGVPGYMVGLPQSQDSLVYNTAALTLDFHWRACLRNLVRPVMAALSHWALPFGTTVELNRDEYVKPGLLERAQTYQILHGIEDEGVPVLSVQEIRELERYSTAAPSQTLTSGVLQ